MQYPKLFKNFGKLEGKDWLKRLPVDDRKAFGWLGCEAHEHGHLGGKARVASAKRDERGRFVKGGQHGPVGGQRSRV